MKKKRKQPGQSPRYMPTPEQIAEEAAKIRAENENNPRPKNTGKLSRSPKEIHKIIFASFDFE